jgi:hypothetical protein
MPTLFLMKEEMSVSKIFCNHGDFVIDKPIANIFSKVVFSVLWRLFFPNWRKNAAELEDDVFVTI